MVVVDTNVMVAGLRSRNGASFKVLTAIANREVEYAVSAPLIFEYEDAIKRSATFIQLDAATLETFLDSVVNLGTIVKTHFLWRPFLPDPKDDHVLELAVAAQAKHIVTFNERDFRGIEAFSIATIKPQNFLKMKGLL